MKHTEDDLKDLDITMQTAANLISTMSEDKVANLHLAISPPLTITAPSSPIPKLDLHLSALTPSHSMFKPLGLVYTLTLPAPRQPPHVSALPSLPIILAPLEGPGVITNQPTAALVTMPSPGAFLGTEAEDSQDACQELEASDNPIPIRGSKIAELQLKGPLPHITTTLSSPILELDLSLPIPITSPLEPLGLVYTLTPLLSRQPQHVSAPPPPLELLSVLGCIIATDSEVIWCSYADGSSDRDYRQDSYHQPISCANLDPAKIHQDIWGLHPTADPNPCPLPIPVHSGWSNQGPVPFAPLVPGEEHSNHQMGSKSLAEPQHMLGTEAIFARQSSPISASLPAIFNKFKLHTPPEAFDFLLPGAQIGELEDFTLQAMHLWPHGSEIFQLNASPVHMWGIDPKASLLLLLCII